MNHFIVHKLVKYMGNILFFHSKNMANYATMEHLGWNQEYKGNTEKYKDHVMLLLILCYY